MVCWESGRKHDLITFPTQHSSDLKSASYNNEVYKLPKHLDEKVAALHFAKLGVELETLTDEQAAYIGVAVQGPFKPEYYRY